MTRSPSFPITAEHLSGKCACKWAHYMNNPLWVLLPENIHPGCFIHGETDEESKTAPLPAKSLRRMPQVRISPECPYPPVPVLEDDAPEVIPVNPKKQRRLDPHTFTPAFASGNCVHCGRDAKHWLHRGWLYRLFTSRPADIQFRRIQ